MIYLRLPFPALLKNVWKKFFWLQDELQCVSVELGKEQRHTENILELKTFRILNIKGSSKGLNPPQRLRSCKLRHSTLCLAHITLPWGCAVQCTRELQHACGSEPALLTGSSGPIWWVAQGFRFSPMLLIHLEKLPVNTCKATSFVFFWVCPHPAPWAQKWQGWMWAWHPTQQQSVLVDWHSSSFLPGSLLACWGCLLFHLCSSRHNGVLALHF